MKLKIILPIVIAFYSSVVLASFIEPPYRVSKGGTNSSTALNNNRIIISSSGKLAEQSALSPSLVIVTDANGLPIASSVSTTTLGFLDATSSIQTQLNGKLGTGGTAATATAPATGSAHGLVTLDGSGHFQSVAPGANLNVACSNGTDWLSCSPAAATYTAPAITKLTSGSGTYTTPTSPAPLYLHVKLVGGGGGGGGSGTSTATGGTGGTTTFGSSFLTATGGTGGSNPYYSTVVPTGGTATIVGLTGIAIAGNGGNAAATASSAGSSGPWGGAGATSEAGAGQNADANSGAGGGGGGSNGAIGSGTGGASGGFIDVIIPTPAATYSYSIGAGGTAGSGTQNGGIGGSGAIVIEAHYQ